MQDSGRRTLERNRSKLRSLGKESNWWDLWDFGGLGGAWKVWGSTVAKRLAQERIEMEKAAKRLVEERIETERAALWKERKTGLGVAGRRKRDLRERRRVGAGRGHEFWSESQRKMVFLTILTLLHRVFISRMYIVLIL